MDLVKNAYILPVVKLPYFEFIKALPEPVMKPMLAIMLVCAILIAAGVFFRYACITFGSFYLCFFLLEKSIYNNHIYLFITLAFLLPFTHADDFLSFKKKDKDKPLLQIQFWEIFLIQLQFAIVYFYGGWRNLVLNG